MLIPVAYALDYSVQVSSPSSVNAYEGDPVSTGFSATITNNGNYCAINCQWTTSLNTAGSDLVKVPPSSSKKFPFQVKAQGSGGTATYTLTVSCDRDTEAWNCYSFAGGEGQWTSSSYSFTYLHPGDGICTNSREKCDNYLSFLKDSACTCSSDKECKPNSNRGADDKGCSTFCGNKIAEKQWETCNNCPDDIGRCDGTSCLAANECEGKYCVHNSCNHLAYIPGYTYCDNNVGESCKNSASDCACGSNQRCSNSGVCETYCGNGVCEANERGICNADCTWCGDGTCQSDESCSSCSDDCGICKTPTKEEELQRNVDILTEQSTHSNQTIGNVALTSFNENKTSYIIGIIAIVLVLGYVYYSYKKKKEKSPEGIVKYSLKCPKCNNNVGDEEQQFCHHCGHKLIEEKKEEEEKPKKESKRKKKK